VSSPVRERLRALGRVQGTTRFKVIASIVIGVLAAVVLAGWLVLAYAPDTAATAQQAAEAAAASQQVGEGVRAQTGATAVRELLGATSPVLAIVGVILAATAVLLIITWLGVLLTYLALGFVGLLVVAPLWFIPSAKEFALVLAGAIALTGSFAALLQGVRVLLGYRTPIFAVAQTVLAEAVRMKISIVFIVMLVFLLAALPAYLDPSRPLRYRVQTFLQWGTSGAYWLLLFLTLFFSIATVAFEQRDKVIWQTMTKPVRPIEYLLGKWLGVISLNAALLLATASGIFLFTEYLRNQPAQGEIRAYVARVNEGPVTTDRRILETQVLTARRVMEPNVDELLTEEQYEELVNAQIEETQRREQGARVTAEGRRQIEDEVRSVVERQYRTIPPMGSRQFVFEGLSRERDRGEPLDFQFRVKSGTNLPSALYEITFLIGGKYAVPRQTSLDVAQTMQIPADSIDDDGRLVVEIINGNPYTQMTNSRSIVFEPGTLQVLTNAGSFEANYLRVTVVLWLKLCFIAAVGVACATFLSFPVACLTAFVILLAAESSPFLNEALDYFPAEDLEGNIQPVAFVIRLVAVPIATVFRWYGDLRPTTDLVDGRIVPWSSLAFGAVSLAGSCAIMLFGGWLIFRKRELATYSGK
jgi:ABC-type transport system involved in multi-copper enzyme maturation permease subunit